MGEDLSTPGSAPTGITMGPDGKVWIAETRISKLGRLDPAAGTIAEFDVVGWPGWLATAPDGSIWYTLWDEGMAVRFTP